MVWKKSKVKPNRILWTKGRFKPGYGYKDWINIDDIRNYSQVHDKNQNYEVGARERINPKTISGRFKYFKTKKSALRFVKIYLKKREKK